jgi:Raf kinase inhibitor-like YbhB/YbcL family protein
MKLLFWQNRTQTINLKQAVVIVTEKQFGNIKYSLPLLLCMCVCFLLFCSCQGKKPEPQAVADRPMYANDPKPLIENTTPKPKPTKKRWVSKTPVAPLFPSPAHSVSVNYGNTATPGGNNMEIRLASQAFKEGETIPKKHTGEGADVSPDLAWDKIPPGTKSFTIICHDPDAPAGDWVHWVIFNIDPATTTIPEKVPQNLQVLGNAFQGKNSSGRIGYSGPMPPPGKAHRYIFTLYALDTMLPLTSASDRAQVEAAMKGHILAQTQLMGIYKR